MSMDTCGAVREKVGPNRKRTINVSCRSGADLASRVSDCHHNLLEGISDAFF
jgi:cobalamin biosynthesis protein CbiD